MTDLAREVAEGLGWDGWVRDPPEVKIETAYQVLEEMRKRGVDQVNLNYNVDNEPVERWSATFWKGGDWWDGWDADLPTAIFKATKEALTEGAES